jgi:hypothetical protein
MSTMGKVSARGGQECEFGELSREQTQNNGRVKTASKFYRKERGKFISP